MNAFTISNYQYSQLKSKLFSSQDDVECNVEIQQYGIYKGAFSFGVLDEEET